MRKIHWLSIGVSSLLFNPLFHEGIHCIIAKLLGQRILELGLIHMVHEGQLMHWQWDAVTVVLPFVLAGFSLIVYYKDEMSKIRGTKLPKPRRNIL